MKAQPQVSGIKFQVVLERKELVLQAIRDFQKSRGIPPSILDLAQLTGIMSTSLLRLYLDKLAHDRLIIRYHGLARGIVLVER